MPYTHSARPAAVSGVCYHGRTCLRKEKGRAVDKGKDRELDRGARAEDEAPDAESTTLALDEPDQAFFDHLMECYEWKTTGQRGVNWSAKVAKYRIAHPMELEARPTLAETTGLLTGQIDAGVKFAAAVHTLFPAGTSVEGDRDVRDLARKGPRRSSRPSRYIGGPSTMALWAEKPVAVAVTPDAARASRSLSVPEGLPMDTVIGVVTGHCICVDLRGCDVPSPSDDLPVVGAVLHLTTMSKYLAVLYDVLMEKGDRFDLVSVPLYYATDSMAASQRKRLEVLAGTPLSDPPEPGAYDWINVRAWKETAPFLDKMLALFLTDGFDVRECEGVPRKTFIAFEEGEVERHEEEERRRAEEARRLAEEEELAAARAAEEAAARRRAEEARRQAVEEARRKAAAEQHARDVKNLPAIKNRAIEAEARVRALQAQIKQMKREQRDLMAAYDAQGAQLAKEQGMIGSVVSKSASLQHSLRAAEDAARKAQSASAAVRERAALFDTLEFPQTPLGALLLAKKAFPDRLLVLDQAQRSAREFATGDVRETWAALRDMAVVLHPLMFGDESADIPARFEERSVLRIAMSEGPMTQKDPNLMKLRRVSYEGRIEDMSAHVKGRSTGEGQPALRVHFFPDHAKQLIVIGHCGNHLPTYAYQGK